MLCRPKPRSSLLLPVPARHTRLLVLLRPTAGGELAGATRRSKRPKPPLDCIGHMPDARLHRLAGAGVPSPATPPAGSPRRRTKPPGSAHTAACRAAGGRNGCRCAGAWGDVGWQGQRARLGPQAPPCSKAGSPGSWLQVCTASSRQSHPAPGLTWPLQHQPALLPPSLLLLLGAALPPFHGLVQLPGRGE